ncbi:MAG: peptidase C14 [Candidatus Methylomirabilota bacterium]|nr:caspase family protein [Candidatus Methylomirabilis sp.]NJD67800.1 caspase family protein [candidate division NC10 bacterium]PWB47236.1 MAG: peptidase C14 [candidate division NC10 bacterium]
MRRALCVGIDSYSFGALRGCVSDATRMAALLEKHEDGSPNFGCRTMVAPNGGSNDVATRASLKQAIEQLFKDKSELAVLHFSGHGTENNLGGYLVTQDAKSYDEGVSMTDILKMANDSKADEVVILLDCCHSGNLGNVPAIDNTKALLREGVSILTASRGDQVSVEASGAGLFTSLVADALEGGAADLMGNVTAPAIYAFVEAALGAWDQRPLFKSHVSKLIALRKCTPAVETAIIRELPIIFPVPAEDLPLSPAFEPSCEKQEAAKTEVFRKLQMLSRVHVVVPVDAPHMYDAAMQSKACRLTASGRYYWRLAKNNRI